MQLTGLKEPYKQMKQLGLERIKFEFTYATIDFDVIFSIDENPFVLMFGVKKENIYFEIKVKKGFNIVPYIEGSVFLRLMKLFRFKNIGDEKFKISYFFEMFNKKIPKLISIKNWVSSAEVFRYKSDIEEPEKKYFMGWIDHGMNKKLNPDYKGTVQEPNLEKTRIGLGEKAYLRCKKCNISSKWTAEKDEENLSKLKMFDDLEI